MQNLTCEQLPVHTLGSMPPFERFGQLTGYVRLADVDDEIFENPIMYDCFAQERTVAKNKAMSESRTKLPIGICLGMTAVSPNRTFSSELRRSREAGKSEAYRVIDCVYFSGVREEFPEVPSSRMV